MIILLKILYPAESGLYQTPYKPCQYADNCGFAEHYKSKWGNHKSIALIAGSA
jgi:hypothetical protein